MWTIRQTADGWEVLDGAGVAVFAAATGEHKGYADCLAWLTDNQLAVAEPGETLDESAIPDGVLVERWQGGPSGIVSAAATDDGRDFTGCVFTWRPSVAPLPLMLLTETTYGHFEAKLAGFIDAQGDPTAAGAVQGWFHDSEIGRQARDIIRAQGAFGCSVDPGLVEASFVCTEEVQDDDGWTYCDQGSYVFSAYEIAGVTLVPFPAFASAAIELVPEAATGDVIEPIPVGDNAPGETTPLAAAGALESVPTGTHRIEVPAPARAAAHAQLDEMLNSQTVRAIVAAAPARPPAAWLAMEEPPDDDPRYVPQRDGQIGVPLTITDEGQVYGHFGLWGTCHIGRLGECVTPPPSQAAYAHFHIGALTLDDGSQVAVGNLTAGCDHAAVRMRAAAARDHYAHNGVAWADVRASNGRHGAWVAGTLRPDVTPEQVRVLRAGGLSGDWRDLGVGLETVAILAVNVPGFPIVREQLVASGLEIMADAHLGVEMAGGRQQSLVAAGLVARPLDAIEALVAAGTIARCDNCGKRSPGAPGSRLAREGDAQLRRELRELRSMLVTILSRTTPLLDQTATQARERLAAKLDS